MRPIIWTFIAFFFSFNLYAQDYPAIGKWVLGGSGSFLSSKNSDGITNESLPVALIRYNGLYEQKYTEFRINTYAGYELNSHWMLGLILRSENTKEKVLDVINFISGEKYDRLANAQLWAFGGLLRYTINPANSLQGFIQPQFQFFQVKEKLRYDSAVIEEFKATGFRVPVQVGGLYAFNKHWRAILLLGSMEYQQGNITNQLSNSKVDYNSFGFYFRPVNFQLGVEYRF